MTSPGLEIPGEEQIDPADQKADNPQDVSESAAGFDPLQEPACEAGAGEDEECRPPGDVTTGVPHNVPN